jgi:transposase-like protein
MQELINSLKTKSQVPIAQGCPKFPIMNTRLHKLARTTPAVRAEMAASTDSVAVLACRHGVSEATARKWKERTSPHDRSHTAHKLQTTLSPAQEMDEVQNSAPISSIGAHQLRAMR